MPIAVLPVHLVNKIAAGEVIERPASVVKELVENALDAGSTRIDVAIEDGGRRLISVSDNGGGMASEDLALAFVPHATSKLHSEDGLFDIRTMGFRGEALASIASISQAHIRTRRTADVGGHEIDAGGEELGQVRPRASAAGTTVTIRNLFFNTPARRKFMRAAATEAGHVSEQMTRLALPNPSVAFTLTHNGRSMMNLPAVETTARRAADIFGPELAQGLLTVGRHSQDVRIDGLICQPADCRASTKWQYFFLNGRYIRDRLLGHALREAYRGLADASRSPVAIIFIEVDPAEVDVNVHPTKIEVRFRDSQAVHGHLLAALRETLSGANLSPSARLAAGDGQGGPADMPAGHSRESLKQALADFFKSVPPTQPRFNFTHGQAGGAGRSDGADISRGADDSRGAGVSPATAGLAGGPLLAPATRETSDSPAPFHATSASTPSAQPTPAGPAAWPPPAVLQVHNSYIVCQTDDGLAIIDQHALHERLIYNDLLDRISTGRLEGQRLLLPTPVGVTAAQAAMLDANAPLLARLGIEVAPFGPGTWAVQQFPSLLVSRGLDAGQFIRELLDKLADDETTDHERLVAGVLEMLACKAAVKAGDPLSEQEIQSLLARRLEADKASACPHGRPTTLTLTLADLEKQFKRT